MDPKNVRKKRLKGTKICNFVKLLAMYLPGIYAHAIDQVDICLLHLQETNRKAFGWIDFVCDVIYFLDFIINYRIAYLEQGLLVSI